MLVEFSRSYADGSRSLHRAAFLLIVAQDKLGEDIKRATGKLVKSRPSDLVGFTGNEIPPSRSRLRGREMKTTTRIRKFVRRISIIFIQSFCLEWTRKRQICSKIPFTFVAARLTLRDVKMLSALMWSNKRKNQRNAELSIHHLYRLLILSAATFTRGKASSFQKSF